MIEIYLLEQLAAVAQYGTLSAASEQLHISQPALSRSMKKLEEILEVSLFDRTKNKITLNDNGHMAAEFAVKILDEEETMVEQIRSFDRKNNTVTMGSCAPEPITQIVPELSRIYSGMTIASEIKSDEELLKGLKEDTYQFIVLTYPVESEEYTCEKWKAEHLYVTLPPGHRLSKRKKIEMEELNGESILLYSKIGFWHDLCMKMIPKGNFLIQHEYDALGELVQASDLPAFTTDLVWERDLRHQNRIVVPIVTPEANPTYHCICKKKGNRDISKVIKNICVTADK